MVNFQDCLYVWGGSGGDSNLYMLNLTTNQWSILTTTGTPPAPRRDFPYFIYGAYFYILSGASVDLLSYFPVCYRINLQTLVWESLDWDLRRVVFAYTLYDKYLVLLGGILSDTSLTNEMLIGDLTIPMDFLEISPHWDYPKPRLNHCLQSSRKYLWLFGGYSQGT